MVMILQTFSTCLALGLVGALTPIAAIGQEAQPTPTAPGAPPIRVRLTRTPEGQTGDVRALVAEPAEGASGATDEAPPLGEYWIGIALGELPEVARKQLKLEHGLVVDDVIADSPASKA